ncbi:hypothetical protein EN780_03405 [Mesorhizobium sp. M4B.F.Ca.ET.089.01.1.1]|uniref:hypothetical protein n=1 Tax=Mesorhizobium sp. M4B.F.Ca.ET.089.01.1.1 TaxID=2496662 RepID=UPI000FE2F46B|nr:hypothetical protein [Mesorhizobium sp. M4B.F.Ca.ET.089.01.1.1]RWX70454.1 hypothetical protein EN780_03405 [Mesorhizobium sp. M4B.F.Ca.ET.089.01.1.1]
MTCIVGLIDDGAVYMGGDSAAILDSNVEVRQNRKVFRKGAYLIGYAGSYRVGQLIEHTLELDSPQGALLKHMITHVAEKIREISGKESAEVLIGCLGRLFKFSSDFSVAEYKRYAAIGQADQCALGSLFDGRGDPTKRVLRALGAAQEHNAAVRAPFYVEASAGPRKRSA